MQYKLFTALPNFLTDTAKSLLFETDLSEETGRLSWPRIVMYEFKNEWGEIVRSQLPPKNEDRYYYRVLNLEAYEYLCKTGWITIHDILVEIPL